MSALPDKKALTANLRDPIQPQLQRFISRDPIGLRGGLNAYTYANNNPVLFVDPSGLFSFAGNRLSNLQAAIDLVRQVNPNTANSLQNLLDTNKLQLGWVLKLTQGKGIALTLKMKELILIDPSIVPDCPATNEQILYLASILVHEEDHYWNQDHPILRWIYSAIDTGPRELQQVQTQRDFVSKLLRYRSLDVPTRNYARDTLLPHLDNQINNLQTYGRYDAPTTGLSDPPSQVELLP